MKAWPWLVLGGLIGGYFLVQWSRQDFLEFRSRREDWHRRCDAYISAPPSLGRAEQAAGCKAELNELTAYAMRKGWHE